MAGARDGERARRRVERPADHGGEVVVGDRLHHRGELVEDGGRIRLLERVGADRVAQRCHEHRGRESAPAHVAHREHDAVLGDREHVVPVAADLGALDAGLVARRRLEPGEVGQRPGHEAALQLLRDVALRRVELGVLLGDLFESVRQLLGALAAADEAFGDERRQQREQHPDARRAPRATARAGRRRARRAGSRSGGSRSRRTGRSRSRSACPRSPWPELDASRCDGVGRDPRYSA